MVFWVPGGQIIAWLAGCGDSTKLRSMLELTVAALLCYQEPSVLLKEAEDLGNLHGSSTYTEVSVGLSAPLQPSS